MSTPQPSQVDYSTNVTVGGEGTALLGTDAALGITGLAVDEISIGTQTSGVTAGSSPTSDIPGATLNGQYLALTVDSDGSIGIEPASFTSTQDLINAINANAVDGTGPLVDTLHYEVTNGSSSVPDSVALDLTDITLSGPATAPDLGPENVFAYDTVSAGGVQVSVAESTDSKGNLIPADPTLSVTVSVYGADQGSLSFAAPNEANITATTSSSGSGGGIASYTLSGTESQINADLSNLQFTSAGSGSNELLVSATQYAANGTTVLQQTNTTYEGQFVVANSTINVGVGPYFGGEGTALQDTDAGNYTTGLEVTDISVNGGPSVAVPAGSNPNSGIAGGTVDGNYFAVTVDSDGSIGITPLVSGQALVDAINSNTTGAVLADDVTYDVSTPNGEQTQTVALDLTDINFTSIAPFSADSVGVDQTVGLSGLSVSVPASTDGSGSDPVLSVTVSVDNDGNPLDQGALSFKEAAPQGSSTIVAGKASTGVDDGIASYTITGTVDDINSDLANLQFTSSGVQGTNYLVVNGAQYAADGVTLLQQTDNFGEGTIQVTAACFCVGTRILTAQGEVPIEDLAPGDAVVVHHDGRSTRPVLWTGHRQIDCTRHPNPQSVWPVLIRAGAIAAAQPARDLYVSPGHSIYVNGVLTQVENLVNGTTIVQVPRDHVEYWHVELDAHDILLADGLPTESYLDTGNRTAFVGGGEYLELHPDFRPKHWSETCVPLVSHGPEVERAREAILARAHELGFTITNDDDLHILADGERVDPVRLTATRVAFMLPAGRQVVALQSRTFIPAHVSATSRDARTLGVCVGRLQIDGADIALDDASVTSEAGWQGIERYPDKTQRWTRGVTSIPAGARLIVLDLAARGYYWDNVGRPRLCEVSAARA